MAFIDAKRAVSFPLEDKHVMNEHHIVQNSYHDATQKKCPPVVHFNVPLNY